MISCPKCQSYKISGPRYRSVGFGRYSESLVYTCGTCGYEESRPCADAKDDAAVVITSNLIPDPNSASGFRVGPARRS
jgi:hypothetical protein